MTGTRGRGAAASHFSYSPSARKLPFSTAVSVLRPAVLPSASLFADSRLDLSPLGRSTSARRISAIRSSRCGGSVSSELSILLRDDALCNGRTTFVDDSLQHVSSRSGCAQNYRFGTAETRLNHPVQHDKTPAVDDYDQSSTASPFFHLLDADHFAFSSRSLQERRFHRPALNLRSSASA